MDIENGYSTPVARYYIDTRPFVPNQGSVKKNVVPPLPLLSTLPQDIQDRILRFRRPEDKLMSLASALLKYFYIHRTAKVPWADVRISKTPAPHARPYWDPPPGWHGKDFNGVEFNVSHQAGLVILAGCRTPGRPDIAVGVDNDSTSVVPGPTQEGYINIGVDIACTHEERRTPDCSTQYKLDEWVDTFAEMFSVRERNDMKERPVASPTQNQPSSLSAATQVLNQKLRRFYTYWALKESYIKMVGEGLLASWLRELEFVNVVSPDPDERLTADEIGLKVLLGGNDITSSVDIELYGLEESFIVATAFRGIAEQTKDLARWKCIDVEEDVRPCAESRCSCLK